MNKLAADSGKGVENFEQVFLEPGALYCTSKPAVIRTVLGSCVAVCLYDRHFRAAGMNHYVLPAALEGQSSLRYGDAAIEQLIARMFKLGCGIADLRAKVFGGAAVLPFGVAEDTVGSKNVAAGLELLHRRSIPIVARRTGGENGLLVRLHTTTGRVLVRQIAASAGRRNLGRVASHDSQAAGGAGEPVHSSRNAPANGGMIGHQNATSRT